jgi:hypothetical protein
MKIKINSVGSKGHLSSSSRLRNRLAFISHMQVSYGHGYSIIC